MGTLFEAWRKEYPDGTRILWECTLEVTKPEWFPGVITGTSFMGKLPVLTFLLEGEVAGKGMTRFLSYGNRKLIKKH